MDCVASSGNFMRVDTDLQWLHMFTPRLMLSGVPRRARCIQVFTCQL